MSGVVHPRTADPREEVTVITDSGSSFERRPPGLERVSDGRVAFLHVPALRERGLVVAFSERGGGVSRPPYATLDLAAHTGDDPRAVDENRARLLRALGLGGLRQRLTCAEQVHGDAVAEVTGAEAGSGASAVGGRPPVPGADALVTAEPDVPLMLLFADCVPVVLVAPASRAVAVAHAGWRGALAGLPAKAASALARTAGADPAELLAYIGPCVAGEDYEVSEEIAQAFRSRYPASVSCARHVDLGAAVLACLAEAGVATRRVVSVSGSTAGATDRFFSHRAEGVTGRHAAVGAVLGGL